MTLIFLACEAGDLMAVRVYVTADPTVVNTTNDSGFTPLHFAASNIYLEVVELLVNSGADTNAKTNFGWTPLHDAAQCGHLGVVEFLVKHGAVVNATVNLGYTPLHEAARRGHLGVVKFLVSKGADVNAVDIDGATPLHDAAAAFNNHHDVTLYLWPLTDCAPSDTEDGTINELDHAARMCLLLGARGFTSDMITFS
jgi:ankyrin repeat protein